MLVFDQANNTWHCDVRSKKLDKTTGIVKDNEFQYFYYRKI